MVALTDGPGADLDLASLLDSWLLALRAERRSAATVNLYRIGVKSYLTWCDAAGGRPSLERAQVVAWVADLLDQGREAATVTAYQTALRRFVGWLVAEGELQVDPLAGLGRPKLDTKVVPVLADDQLRALVKACEGKAFRDRRDEAMVRLMAETGLRAGEVVALDVADVDLRAGSAVVRRGKGGKGRLVPFGPQTGRAIDRWLRTRRQHPRAGTAALWLADRGGGRLSYGALYDALRARARTAGIEGFHPHQLRHTAASRWLSAGGSEGGLMSVAGWQRREQLDRYSAATRAERAAEESRRLGLGDL